MGRMFGCLEVGHEHLTHSHGVLPVLSDVDWSFQVVLYLEFVGLGRYYLNDGHLHHQLFWSKIKLKITVDAQGCLCPCPSWLPRGRDLEYSSHALAFSLSTLGSCWLSLPCTKSTYPEPTLWYDRKFEPKPSSKTQECADPKATWRGVPRLWPNGCTVWSCWRSGSSNCPTSSRSGEPVWPISGASYRFKVLRQVNRVQSSYRFILWGLFWGWSVCLWFFLWACWNAKVTGRAQFWWEWSHETLLWEWWCPKVFTAAFRAHRWRCFRCFPHDWYWHQSRWMKAASIKDFPKCFSLNLWNTWFPRWDEVRTLSAN